MNNAKNKVVVISGAASGIGRELALQLAQKGAKLALSDINAETLDETIKLLPAGVEAKAYIVDMSKREAVFAHAAEVARDFGTAHWVFNNAGATVVGTIEHLTIEEIEWQLNINLWGVIYGTKAFLPMLLAQREGVIVNISSIFGLIGFPAQGAYNIAKFGVRGLTECLWSELKGTGVSAVCVHPGGIKTNIGRTGRISDHAGEFEAEQAKKVGDWLITPPADCARDIIQGVEAGKSRIITGFRSSTVFWLARLLPNHYPLILRWLS